MNTLVLLGVEATLSQYGPQDKQFGITDSAVREIARNFNRLSLGRYMVHEFLVMSIEVQGSGT